MCWKSLIPDSQAEAEKKTSWTRTRSYIRKPAPRERAIRASEQGEQTGVGQGEVKGEAPNKNLFLLVRHTHIVGEVVVHLQGG